MRINCFVTPGTLNADQVSLSPSESHHLTRVLRVERGQELTLFDGEGIRAKAIVIAVSKKALSVKIIKRDTVSESGIQITLIQALPKPERFEWILQKATELGIRRIQPILSTHTIHRSKNSEKQTARWQSILRNAAQQCGVARLPQIQPIKKISSIIPTLEKMDIIFIGSLRRNVQPFREAFQKIDKSKINTAALLIGPEGDFTREEIDAVETSGAIPVTFCQQILRTETAAIFGLSVLVYELATHHIE